MFKKDRNDKAKGEVYINYLQKSAMYTKNITAQNI